MRMTALRRRFLSRLGVRAGAVGVLLVWPLARAGVDVGAAPGADADRAVAVIRQVQQAQQLYRSVHGYYDRLECLVQDTCVPLIPYPPGYLNPEAVRPAAHGYRFRLHDGERVTAAGAEPASPTAMRRFAFTAVPLYPTDGSRAFCGDASGTVYVAHGREARVENGRCVETAGALADR
jgi:hypothetical protein